MEKKLKSWKLWVGIIVVILIVLGIVFINNSGQSINTSTKCNKIGKEIKLSNNIRKELYEKVKKDITDSLKTPSTAVFPKMKEWNIRVNSNNVIEVKSYVDSQNSFGAMLRADFEQKYIILNKDDYLCIYKEFNNETEFDISERTENKKIINKNITESKINDFITKTKENQYNTLYDKFIDYTFDEKTQQLEWNIEVTSQSNGDLKNNCYLELTSAIDECICIPTVKTTINAYFYEEGKPHKIATVKDIDFDFMIKRWNILCDMGINSNHLTTNLEEELAEKLIQEDIIKNMKVDYWNN